MRAFAPSIVLPSLVLVLLAGPARPVSGASPRSGAGAALRLGLVRGGRAQTATLMTTPGVYLNPAYGRAIEPSDKLILMPMEFHGFPPEMKLMLEVTMFAQLLSTVGRFSVSLHPLRRGFQAAGFAKLNWQVGHAIYHRITRHRQPALAKDRCLPWLSALAGQLPKFGTWAMGALRAVGVPIPTSFSPRYLLTVHVDRLAFDPGTQMMKYRVIAGIVDIAKRQVVTAHFYTLRSRNRKRDYVQSMNDLRKRIPRVFKPVFRP